MASSDIPFLERDFFAEKLERFQASYVAARPFPHIVIDNFLPAEIADRIADEFPDPSFASYQRKDDAHQHKKLDRVAENDFKSLPGFTRHLLGEFNGKVFLDFLEGMTGVTGLIPDPHFHGGGLHQILPGGKLAVHADFNLDRRRKLDRRVNVLIYFNRDWRDEYGGNLELWDEEMARCEQKIAPVFNRCVIFNTNSTSFHGHPDALKCPEGRTRNSIALYYYTNGRPADEKTKPHDTLWQRRPGEAKAEPHTWRGLVRRAANALLPPLLMTLVRRLRRGTLA